MLGRTLRPRLVTFDVTGTLLMTRLEEHYVAIASRHGLTLDPKKVAGTFKTNFRRLNAEHPIYGRHTGLGWENWWRTIVHNVFKEQHRELPDDTLDKVASSLISCYGTRMCWHKYPGAIELLEYLRERGLILGVISNFDERLEPILLDTGIRPYFSFVLTSYGFGVEKPSSTIFAEALRLTRSRHDVPVHSSEAVHVGDTIDSDYVGAKNANWRALFIKHDEGDVDEKRVAREDVFRSLTELRAHFAAVLGNDEKNV